MRTAFPLLLGLFGIVACSEEFTAAPADGGATSGGASGTGGVGASAGSGSAGGSSGTGGSGGALTDAALGGTGGKTPGDAGSDAPVVAKCAAGKVGDLQETFDSTWTSRWSTWNDSSTEAAVVGGIASLKLQPNVNGYAGFSTTKSWDTRDCAVSVEVLKTPDVTLPSTEIYFSLGDSSMQNAVIFTAFGGVLYVERRVGGTKAEQNEITYSAAMQRFWRIREAGGTTYFETAPDGKTWSAHLQAPTNPQASAYFVEIGSGSWDTPPSTTSISQFDNVNVVP